MCKKLILIMLAVMIGSNMAVFAQSSAEQNICNNELQSSSVPNWEELRKNTLTGASGKNDLNAFFETQNSDYRRIRPFDRYVEEMLKKAEIASEQDNSANSETVKEVY